jgi:hypothetical protein
MSNRNSTEVIASISLESALSFEHQKSTGFIKKHNKSRSAHKAPSRSSKLSKVL